MKFDNRINVIKEDAIVVSQSANLSFYTQYSEDKRLKFDCVTGSNVSHHFPLHIHDSLCIGVVTKGWRKIIWTDSSDTVTENEMFIININQPHAIAPYPHDYIAITIKGLCRDVVFENVITPDNIDLFYRLFYAVRKGDLGSLSQNWDILYRYLYDYHKTPKTFNSDELFLKKALEYIRLNHQNQISVEEIAEHACLSTFHFSRLFRKLTGLSPHNYLKQYRLSQSYKRLQNNTSVFDTAIETGFYDSSHFIKTFHSYMAVSPKEYQDSVTAQ